MMRLIFLLLLAFVAGSGTCRAAESDPLGLTGSRVRLIASDRSTAAGRLSSHGQMQTGTVTEVRGDTLLFTADQQSIQTFVQTSSLTSLEVSRGKRSHALAGVGIGLLVGAAAGAVIASSGNTTNNEESGLVTLFGTLAGGAAGIVVGGIAGSAIRTERWNSLRLPVSVGFFPNGHAIGLSVALTTW